METGIEAPLFVTFYASPQVSLVNTAEASQYNKRFIPSIWDIPYSRAQVTFKHLWMIKMIVSYLTVNTLVKWER